MAEARPVGLQVGAHFTAFDVVGPGFGPLAVLIGGEDQLAAVRGEFENAVIDVPFVICNEPGFGAETGFHEVNV
jgi:hypothetical protein